jgi:uncharacterized protein
MFAYPVTGPVRAVALMLALIVWAPSVQAQQPSANAIAMAKELIALKGATNIYDPAIPGTIERAKGAFMQMNPMLGKDINEVAAKLHTEYASRVSEIRDIVVKAYAASFTDQELREVLAFYRTPLGKKLIEQEPKILDRSASEAQAWVERFSEEIIKKMRAEMKRRGHDL